MSLGGISLSCRSRHARFQDADLAHLAARKLELDAGLQFLQAAVDASAVALGAKSDPRGDGPTPVHTAAAAGSATTHGRRGRQEEAGASWGSDGVRRERSSTLPVGARTMPTSGGLGMVGSSDRGVDAKGANRRYFFLLR